jgi:hypothetical protein
MSWQIPTRIEEDIISGRAQYRTFQTGSGGQSILTVPPNAYVVIFGYDFSPAGGGLTVTGFPQATANNQFNLASSVISQFETQQISFYTGQDYFPFIHHVNAEVAMMQISVDPISGVAVNRPVSSIDNTPIARQVYITSSSDVTITHGLIFLNEVNTIGTIPVTNRTPGLLTYGGSGISITAQTDYGPNVSPNQFMQPSPKDFEAFGLGLLPNGATDQAWARPDINNGLVPSATVLTSLGNTFRDSAACNYFLCLHYALYTSTIPEQRG